MDKKELQLIKGKILKCLTEDFTYGKTKTGKPLKHPKKNIAIFDPKDGWSVFDGMKLEMIMDKVVLGLYFSLEDNEDNRA